MNSHSQKLIVIYDGKCRFCRRSVSLFSTLDWLNRFEFVDNSDWKSLQEKYSQLSGYEAPNSLVVIERNTLYWGFFAIRRMVLSTPMFWPFLLAFYFPTAGYFGPILYAWVAKNRYRIGCDTPDCSLRE